MRRAGAYTGQSSVPLYVEPHPVSLEPHWARTRCYALTHDCQTGVSIAWSAAELVTQGLARNKPVKRYRGIHPGAHIGIQLGLVAGQGTSGGLTIPDEICDPYWDAPCVTPEIEIVVGTLACVLG